MLIITKNNNIVKKSVLPPKATQCPPCPIFGCLVKVCKLRRIVAISGIIFCSIMGLQLISSRSSIITGEGLFESSAGLSMTDGKKSAKDYPGYFMKGKYPFNNTFCRYNYGLPHKFNWDQVKEDGTPQLGLKSPYRVIYNAIERTMFDKFYTLDQVTYATHVTPEFLYHIVEIARYWDGPISVAAFVPNYDLEITMKLFAHLCKCYDGMSKVSVHLVYPETDVPIFFEQELMTKPPPKVTKTDENEKEINNETKHKTEKKSYDKLDIDYKEKEESESKSLTPGTAPKLNPLRELVCKHQLYRDQNMINLEFKDCSNPDMSSTRTFRSRHGLIYPVNVCRNVARNASTTQYNLVSDVELIPSEGLATRFTIMLKKHRINGHYGVIPKWRLAFVIPVFEVELGEDIPRNKSSLQQLYADGKAVYFHRWVCSHCQKIPDLQAWLKDDPGKVIKPFAVTKRQFPYHRWEPIYIATKHTPWYSETLSWEGRQDKMTQMLEMCLKSYDFVVVDGAFLCHSPGVKSRSKAKSWRHRHEQVNTKQYDMIVRNLAERYPANPKCRLG